MGRRMVLVMLAALWTGCVSQGVKIEQAQLDLLQPGKTTYWEVVGTYGAPTTETRQADGSRQVTYAYMQVQHNAANFIPIAGALVGGMTSETTAVTLEFDRHERYVTYTSTQGKNKMGTGLISGGKQ